MTYTETLTMSMPSEREVQVTRGFNAPKQMLFDALTRPSLLTRWMHGPNGWKLSICEVDLRVGGKFRYVWRKPDGREMGMGGVFREVVPPDRLVHVEVFDEDWTGGETTVTTVLDEEGGRTILTVTILYASMEARDAALSTQFVSGMEAGYNTLADLLAASAR